MGSRSLVRRETYTPELCAEREKAEELYTEFNQTRPSEKAKRAELLRQLLPHMEEHVVILPHLYVDYGYHCFIGAGTYINHGAYLMDCAKNHTGQALLHRPQLRHVHCHPPHAAGRAQQRP